MFWHDKQEFEAFVERIRFRPSGELVAKRTILDGQIEHERSGGSKALESLVFKEVGDEYVEFHHTEIVLTK